MSKLFERFADDPLVTWHFIDNRGMPVEAEEVSAEEGLRLLGLIDRADLHEKFNEVIDNAKLTKRDRERFRDQSLPSEFGSAPAGEAGTASSLAQEVGYGDRNIVFTKERLARAQESVRRKLNPNRLSAGIDPTTLPHLLVIAGYHLEAGSIKFADWSSKMIKHVEDWTTSDLWDLYQKALQNVYWQSKRPGLSPEKAESLRNILATATSQSNEPFESPRINPDRERLLRANRPRLVKARDVAGAGPGLSTSGTPGGHKDIMHADVDRPRTEAEASARYETARGARSDDWTTEIDGGLEANETSSTMSTYSGGPTHLTDRDIYELMSRPDMKVTRALGAGAARPHRHHLFIQTRRDWFEARGIKIDRYTIEMSQGEHSAYHTMGWNQHTEDFIALERALGRDFTPREILVFGVKMRRMFRLKGRKVIPYED